MNTLNQLARVRFSATESTYFDLGHWILNLSNFEIDRSTASMMPPVSGLHVSTMARAHCDDRPSRFGQRDVEACIPKFPWITWIESSFFPPRWPYIGGISQLSSLRLQGSPCYLTQHHMLFMYLIFGRAKKKYPVQVRWPAEKIKVSGLSLSPPAENFAVWQISCAGKRRRCAAWSLSRCQDLGPWGIKYWQCSRVS